MYAGLLSLPGTDQDELEQIETTIRPISISKASDVSKLFEGYSYRWLEKSSSSLQPWADIYLVHQQKDTVRKLPLAGLRVLRKK